MDAADKYISALQERFTNVTVKWNPPPHPIFENQFCALTFISKSDPEVVHQVPFDNGLGFNKTEDDINALIILVAHNIDLL